jgi:hypothetical protein
MKMWIEVLRKQALRSILGRKIEDYYEECSYYPVMAKRWAFLPTIH